MVAQARDVEGFGLKGPPGHPKPEAPNLCDAVRAEIHPHRPSCRGSMRALHAHHAVDCP